MVTGGPVFTADPARPWVESVVIDGSDIVFAGSATDAGQHAGPSAEIIDAEGGLVLPGFVDGHIHVLLMGAMLKKAHLRSAHDLDEIIRRLSDWHAANPTAPRVLGTNWLYTSLPDRAPHRKHLDAVFPDKPVYLEAYDFHSSWVNGAALAELGVTDDTPDPPGGRIARDPDTGAATGHLLETASSGLVWPLLADVSDEERSDQLLAALAVFNRAGITSVTEMATREGELAAMARARAENRLTVRVAAHYYVPSTGDPEEDLSYVERAIELAREYDDHRLRVAGIKIVSDGTVDGCTAAMHEPYVNGTNADPIWDPESLQRVVDAADAAGLQVAIHAIGDRAITQAIDAFEHAAEVNGTSGRRHRLEHLEVARAEDIGRIGLAGITASMQPVHVDPSIGVNWAENLGPERAKRGWPWPDYVSAGARLVFGTDAPTAPHDPFETIYVATTRRSASDPALPAHQPQWALPVEQAVVCATRGPASASFLERRTGTIERGKAADLVILDSNPMAGDPEAWLETGVVATFVDGEMVYRA